MEIKLMKSMTLSELSKRTNLDEQIILDSNPNLTLSFIPEEQHLYLPDNCVLDWRGYSIIEPLQKETEIIKKVFDSQSLYKEITKLKESYPFIQTEIIGYSVLNKPIIEIRIGNGPKKIHMNGSFHANEWITTSIMMYWLHHFLKGIVHDDIFQGASFIQMYKETTISFVPMVNPDGVDLVLNGLPHQVEYEAPLLQMNNLSIDFKDWKANIRGIDLNNQYPVKWEIEKARKLPKVPAPRDYPGDQPLSEPEAIFLAELVKARNFDRVLAFHTQGEEIYWGYERKEPKEAELIVKEFEKLSGYKAVRYIDSHAGFRDWFVHDFKKAGFTIELGNGVNPLPFEQFEEIYEKSKGIFFASLYM
ncbi:M14 family metallopeptidase [Metabacillus sp. HB246100]